jgi:hypothetical protein
MIGNGHYSSNFCRGGFWSSDTRVEISRSVRNFQLWDATSSGTASTSQMQQSSSPAHVPYGSFRIPPTSR